MTSDLPGSQGIRQQFNAVTLGFLVAFGGPIILTETPDRRHSKLVWRLMRCRKNDTGLLNDDEATSRRRAYAGPDRPSLYALPEEEISEQVSLEIDIPSLEEAIAMIARDPLSTVLHFDVDVRVILSYLSGLRMCLHCPRCSTDDFTAGHTCERFRACRSVPCQNKFGKNARIMGGTFGMAEALLSCSEHQGNETPHIHGLLAVVSPYHNKTLLELRDLIKNDMREFQALH